MTPRDPHVRESRLPIEVLRATYDEVVRVGSQRLVAQAHGWHQAMVRHRVLSYMRHAGIEGDPPGVVSRSHAHRGSLSHSGQGARTEHRMLTADLAAAHARLFAVEAENADLRERIADLERVDARFDRLEALIAARPSGVILQPSHRRIKDGGTPVKAQLKAARRAVA